METSFMLQQFNISQLLMYFSDNYANFIIKMINEILICFFFVQPSILEKT